MVTNNLDKWKIALTPIFKFYISPQNFNKFIKLSLDEQIQYSFTNPVLLHIDVKYFENACVIDLEFAKRLMYLPHIWYYNGVRIPFLIHSESLNHLLCSNNDHIFNFIITMCNNLNIKYFTNETMNVAIQYCNFNTILYLCNHNCILNDPITACVKYNKLYFLKYFIKCNHNVSHYAIKHAFINGNMKIAKVLIEYPFVSEMSMYIKSVKMACIYDFVISELNVFEAIKQNNVELVKYYLTKTCPTLNMLHFSLKEDVMVYYMINLFKYHPDMLYILILYNKSQHFINHLKYKYTPPNANTYAHACSYGRTDMIDMLDKVGCKYDENSYYAAIMIEHLPILEHLLYIKCKIPRNIKVFAASNKKFKVVQWIKYSNM